MPHSHGSQCQGSEDIWWFRIKLPSECHSRPFLELLCFWHCFRNGWYEFELSHFHTKAQTRLNVMPKWLRNGLMTLHITSNKIIFQLWPTWRPPLLLLFYKLLFTHSTHNLLASKQRTVLILVLILYRNSMTLFCHTFHVVYFIRCFWPLQHCGIYVKLLR